MSLKSRFWSKVDKRGPDDCWQWTGALNEHGYGVLRPEGQRHGPCVKAHRVSAELAGMDITDAVVCHRCDNPPCVNPVHLFVGSQADNVRDMHVKGRGNLGSRNGQARLTEQQVREIRARAAAGEQQKVLAREFGVAPITVSNIVRLKSWRHVAVPPPVAAAVLAVVVGLDRAEGVVAGHAVLRHCVRPEGA